MSNPFGVAEHEVSKDLGSVSSAFEQKVKRDKGGRFSTVEEKGSAAISGVKQADRKVQYKSAEYGRKLQEQGWEKPGKAVEEHPYVSLVVAGVAARYGGRKAVDMWATGRLIVREADDFTRVAENIKPTREYDAARDQMAGAIDLQTNMRVEDVPEVLFHGLKGRFTGKTQMPKVEYGEDDLVQASNAQARLFGADKEPISDLNEKMESGGAPYSRNALRMMQGNSADDTLRNVEKRIRGNNHESAFVVIDGELATGMSGTWMMTGYSIPKGVKLNNKTVNFTHNHPAIVESQARSFSPGDFNVLEQIVKAGAAKNSTLRAVYADGTVQEIVITDWRKYQRFNRVVENAINGKILKEGVKPLEDGGLAKLLEVQAMIQAAANGKNGFKIVEHSGFAKSRPMSDTEIRRRKQAQSRVSQATGALGLTSLGAFAASKVPGSKMMTKTPRLRRIANRVDTKKAENIALGTSTAGAGLGGAGSFNFAAYTGAESKKKKPVAKSAPSPFEDGFYGVSYDTSAD